VRGRAKVVVAAGTAVVLGGVASGFAAARHPVAGAWQDAAIPAGTYKISSALTSSKEVPRPKGAAGAKGTFTATLKVSSKTSLAWRLTFSRLTGPATASHIHLGAAGKAGPVAITLCTPCRSGAHGTYTKTIPAAVLRAMVAGKAYANVHTAKNPAGEIRGQVQALSTTNPYANVTVPTTAALVARGKALSTKFSCEGCHTLDGTKSTGPTWKGLAGSRVRLTNGKTVVATDGYLIWSIINPDAEIVAGYSSGLMSSFIGPGGITVAEAKAMTAYIKSVK
jgi:mono/diheme cytochrome c family protein